MLDKREQVVRPSSRNVPLLIHALNPPTPSAPSLSRLSLLEAHLVRLPPEPPLGLPLVLALPMIPLERPRITKEPCPRERRRPSIRRDELKVVTRLRLLDLHRHAAVLGFVVENELPIVVVAGALEVVPVWRGSEQPARA